MSKTDLKDIDNAIENAVYDVQKKETKRNKKLTVNVNKAKFKDYKMISPDLLSPAQVQDCLEEGRKSPLIKSPVADRKFVRCQGVSEKNEIERHLVKETLKNCLKAENVLEYNLF